MAGDREQVFYDEFYRDSERISGSALYTAIRRATVALLRRQGVISPAARLLSVGSGDGRLEAMLAPHVGDVVGIDISPEGIRAASEHARAMGLTNARFVVGDIQAVDFEPASFDVVVAIAVLHHIEDDIERESALRRCLEALKPGGFFVSHDPSARRLVNALKWLVKRKVRQYHSEGEHELAPEAVCLALQRAGFASIQTHFCDFFAGPLAWVWPQCPSALVPVLLAIDHALLHVPILKRFASSYAVIARRP